MNTLIRILGIAAIAGGIVRIADSFVTGVLPPGTLEVLYFLTDVLLLLGTAGIYWSRRTKTGIAGTIGFGVFVIGILLVRASAFGVLGANGYQLAAAIALLGLVILSVETLLRRAGAYLSAAFWLVSLTLGAAAAAGIMPGVLTALAGVAFGLGFIAAGAGVLAG